MDTRTVDDLLRDAQTCMLPLTDQSSLKCFMSSFIGVICHRQSEESPLANGGDRMSRLGRPPIHKDPMTNAERQAKHRVKVRKSREDAVRAMKAAPLYIKWLIFCYEFGERFRLLVEEVLQSGNSVVIFRTPHHTLIGRPEGN
jgi:hypothetical protein